GPAEDSQRAVPAARESFVSWLQEEIWEKYTSNHPPCWFSMMIETTERSEAGADSTYLARGVWAMTTFRRLMSVSTVVGLAAVIPAAGVRGEPTKNAFAVGRSDPPPAKAEPAPEETGLTKFSDPKRAVVTYETLNHELYFAFQVQPKMEAGTARPRDLLVIVD